MLIAFVYELLNTIHSIDYKNAVYLNITILMQEYHKLRFVYTMFVKCTKKDWWINNHDSDLDNTLNQPDDNQTLPKIISEIKKNTVQLDTIDKGLICSICLDDFNSEKEVIFLDCKHIYHMECIIEWINKDASCPLCRKNIQVELSKIFINKINILDNSDDDFYNLPLVAQEQLWQSRSVPELRIRRRRRRRRRNSRLQERNNNITSISNNISEEEFNNILNNINEENVEENVEENRNRRKNTQQYINKYFFKLNNRKYYKKIYKKYINKWFLKKRLLLF